jgi:hypothetical protein
MAQQNLDFTELQELKNQFSLLNEKLEKQRIINEEMIQESMKEKLSYIEKWYKKQFLVCTIVCPIISTIFMIQYMNKGFGYWGFSIFVIVLALVELYWNRICYKALDIKNLSNLNMIQATEKIIKHKQLRTMRNNFFIIPFIILIIWTFLVASEFTWNLPIFILLVFMLCISLSLGIYQSKQNRKKLESVLEQIKKLRE